MGGLETGEGEAQGGAVGKAHKFVEPLGDAGDEFGDVAGDFAQTQFHRCTQGVVFAQVVAPFLQAHLFDMGIVELAQFFLECLQLHNERWAFWPGEVADKLQQVAQGLGLNPQRVKGVKRGKGGLA